MDLPCLDCLLIHLFFSSSFFFSFLLIFPVLILLLFHVIVLLVLLQFSVLGFASFILVLLFLVLAIL